MQNYTALVWADLLAKGVPVYYDGLLYSDTLRIAVVGLASYKVKPSAPVWIPLRMLDADVIAHVLEHPQRVHLIRYITSKEAKRIGFLEQGRYLSLPPFTLKADIVEVLREIHYQGVAP